MMQYYLWVYLKVSDANHESLDKPFINISDRAERALARDMDRLDPMKRSSSRPMNYRAGFEQVFLINHPLPCVQL